MKKPTGNNVSFGVINFTNFSLGKQNGKQTIYPLGKKHYETTDRLGNVRVTYTDKKSWQQNKFALNVSSTQDYYPFGSVMEGRMYSLAAYRFGFNGKENDNEVIGTGRWQDYGARMYRPDLARFFSPDPLIVKEQKFPWYSSYQFAGNKPIGAIDIEGLEEYYVIARSFIPAPKLNNPDPLSFTVYPYYAGDNRKAYKVDAGKSFRTEQYAYINFNNKTTATNQFANRTIALGSDGRYLKSSDGSEDVGSIYVKMNETSASVNFVIDAKNQLAASRNPFTPAINAKIDVTITPKDDGTFDYYLNIPEMDGFPAFELWIIDGQGNSYLLFGRNPEESGENPFSLYGSGEHSYKLSGNSKNLITKPVQTFEERKNPQECSDDCQE